MRAWLAALALVVVCVTLVSAVEPVQLVIRTHGTVLEGERVSLEGSFLVQPEGDAAEPKKTLELVSWLWDLDGDNVFGETDDSAARGSEVGRYTKCHLVELHGSSSIRVGAQAVVRFGEEELRLSAFKDIAIVNHRPEALVSPSFVALGSTASLSASCRDPGDDATTVEWDLDNDGSFGDVGLAARAGDELGASVRFTAAVSDRDSVARVRVRCTDAEGAKSRIESADVVIPALQRACACPMPEAVPFKQYSLLAAHFDKKDHSKVLLTSRKDASAVGAVFHPQPVRVMSNGVEACARVRLDGYDGTDSHGSISLVFATAIPTTTEQAAALATPALTLSFGGSVSDARVSFSRDSDSVSAGFPARDLHEHVLSMRYNLQRVTVWIDGIEVYDQEQQLPVKLRSEVYVGFVAAASKQQLSVDAASIRACFVPAL